jgi:hypothetical protein
MTTEKYSVQTIRDYLLGRLPDAESERLDELSITEDACAERIREVEHDLVDAYARGELHGATLELFRSRYLATPRGREMTRFAEALQSHEPTTVVRGERRWRERLALAAAVLVLATASVWLLLDNRTLRARVTSAESARDERERQLREAERGRPASAAPPTTDAGAAPAVATLVLAPQLRGAGQLPTVSLTNGAQELPVQLDLEPVDYPSYTASLLASSGDRQLWLADRLIARTVGGRQTIDLRVPATLLNPQEYLIRISGVPARGGSEIVGEYRFKVVR